MTLVRSNTLKEEIRMGETLAKKDIVEVNAVGQHVVVVPAGQPIPEDLKQRKEQAKASGPQAKDADVADAAPAPQKPQRSRRSSSKK